MKRLVLRSWVTLLTVGLFFISPNLSLAQIFSSGSTGADGAFSPSADITVPLPPDGIFNYTTVNIPSGVTVTYQPNVANTPVTILATGDVTIAGTLDVSGGDAVRFSSNTSDPVINIGQPGGPGGFRGGNGGARGGGTPAGPGQGLDGGDIFTGVNLFGLAGGYGLPSTFVSLVPLVGGSGGAGGNAHLVSTTQFSGSSGSGGGGAVVIASSTTITVSGLIDARPGKGVDPFDNGSLVSCGASPRDQISGTGSGGAIRLVSPIIAGGGILTAEGERICSEIGGNAPIISEAGRIRIETLTNNYTGNATPSPMISPVLSPVTSDSTPALVNLPTVTFSSIGGAAAPVAPNGDFGTPDVVLPPGSTNPVNIVMAATNIPLGTRITVRLTRQLVEATTVLSTPLVGTIALSSAMADMTLPLGEVSLLLAFANFTLPDIATLFPLIDGEPVDHIMVAAALGQSSTLSLVTKSGKELSADHLSPQDRLLLAQSWQTLSTTP